ncbi:MAG: ABC transporter permease [Lachnospiraceae bacterium]|nr:ABC transporter permease [Lachnospiraceae bacterium]
MLVFKRFIRNKLAIVGSVIILIMFLFSFVGGVISPYDESQVFMGYEILSKDFASMTASTEYRYTVKEGSEFPSSAKAEFILALNNGKTTFSSMGTNYSIIEVGEDVYQIGVMEPVVKASVVKGIVSILNADAAGVSSELTDAFKKAIQDKNDTFALNGVTYFVVNEGKEYSLNTLSDAAFASYNVFDAYSADLTLSYEFKLAAEVAKLNGETSFMADGIQYVVEDNNGVETIFAVNGAEKTEYALMSDYVIRAVENDVFLDIDFKLALQTAVEENQTSITIPDKEGNEVIYKIERKNDQYTIKADTMTQVIKVYEAPSKAHWLGTDGNGMDILTRLMYGGRISLMIGFVVVVMEVALGILLGGIAGYFGGFIDNLIMRIVDIFYCIPSLPILIILGSVMEQNKINPQYRIYFMMLILAVLGWPGIARLVRGQILSLREQEFMTATEALGISIPRRIFKHLIPNVIPQLIVMATMGLGSIILTESTLSFLGIGVKFPFASWGNIISSVSNVYVMTNYWFVWIPAGFCILFTVLAFNFIGDGLRDAFDPKMKR